MVGAGFLVSAMTALLVLKTDAYQLSVLLLALICISAVGSLFPFRIKVAVRRELGRYAVCGQKWEYVVKITNQTSNVQKGLILVDDIADPRPDFKTLLATVEPFEKHRNAWDRRVLYYRWQWLVRKNMKIKPVPCHLPDIKPGETIEIVMSCIPVSRGWLSFSGVTISRPDVLGLFCRTCTVPLKDKILVLPEMTRVKPVNLVSSRKYHPGGVNQASSIGNSDEFMALRQYRPGDPMRNIHWRSFAKTSQLVIREFEDEHFIRHALILDTFSRPEDHDLFEKSISLAASYAVLLQGPESILDLLFVGHKIYSFSAGRGVGQMPKLLEVLACVDASTRQDGVKRLLPVLSSQIKPISGSVCIFQDWSQGHTEIFRLFEQNRIDARFIVVCRDTDEMNARIQRSVGRFENIEVIRI